MLQSRPTEASGRFGGKLRHPASSSYCLYCRASAIASLHHNMKAPAAHKHTAIIMSHTKADQSWAGKLSSFFVCGSGEHQSGTAKTVSKRVSDLKIKG